MSAKQELEVVENYVKGLLFDKPEAIRELYKDTLSDIEAINDNLLSLGSTDDEKAAIVLAMSVAGARLGAKIESL